MNARLRSICFLMPFVLLFGLRAQALELNGVAPFTELGNEIYLAALFIDSRTSDSGELFSDARERKLEIRFSSDMSRRRWSNNWMQSIAINTRRDALVEAADELSSALSSFAGNLSPGDQVEIHYIPGKGTDIRLNGTTLASNLGPGIFNLFLSSWIGPVPPSSSFRNALLGREDSTVQQDRFYFIEPSPERVAAVRAWAAEDSGAETAATEQPAAEAATPAVAEPPAPAAEPVPEPSEPAVAEAPAAPQPEPVVQPEPQPEPQPAPPEEPVAEAEPTIASIEDNDEGELDLSVAAILAQQEYATGLIRKIYSKVEYPAAAVRRNQEGSVRMRLSLNADGSIASISMVEESAHAALNQEAERAIKTAAPFEALPSSLTGSAFEIEVPIAFRLTSE